MATTDEVRESVFAQHKPLLFSIAYRMLGSAADAEDLVQDCYLRWHSADGTEIRAPKQYLASTLTRLCINHLQSARVRREQYVGPWLPEPLVTGTLPDPVELSESLTMAFLVMLESLSPLERAVFLLAEVFDYRIDEIAVIVGKTSANCRQILHRAREAVARRPQRFVAQPEAVQSVLQRFGDAIFSGNIEGLLEVLDPNVVVHSDGGGKVPAAQRPIHGADAAAKFLIGIAKKGGAGVTPVFAEVNRQPAVLNFRDGSIQSTVIFDISENKIRTVYIVVNPDKLNALPKETQK